MAARDMDWRVFTAEIQSPDVLSAVRGASALGFSALRVVHSSEATKRAIRSELLCEDPWVTLHEHCNAASNAGGWVGWNSECCGLFWLLSKIIAPSATQLRVLLGGDSGLTRAVFQAYQFCQHLDNLVGCDLQWIKMEANELGESANRSSRAFQIYGDGESTSPEGREKGAVKPDATLVVGETPNLVDELLQSAGLDPGDRDVLCCSAREWQQAAEGNGATDHAVGDNHEHWVSPIDLASAALAHDFECWTGAKANFQLIREAYEEFCEF